MNKTFKNEWKEYLSNIHKIVVFDTETSGLNAGYNVILSISWQVLDESLSKIEEHTHYFDWPNDECRVSWQAIDVNGLTKERLSELGTSLKSAGLQDFADAVIDADLLVAHNGNFDSRFVAADARAESVNINLSLPLWDTMTRMTNYCAIPGHYDGYKWPRLIELAKKLNVPIDDIDWHQSASDVEVTARCFRYIAENGIVKP